MYELNVWGKNNSLEIPMTILGDTFSDFLELCFRNADLFSLNRAIWTDCIFEDLQKELEPFLVKEIYTLKWFGYDYSIAPSNDRRQLKVYLYHASTTAKNILLRYCSDVFLRKLHAGVLQDSRQTLEDLCFFSKGKLFVGTVSHEYLLNVLPINKEFENFIMDSGEWNYIEQLPIHIETYIDIQ